jgi:hypothetical protein
MKEELVCMDAFGSLELWIHEGEVCSHCGTKVWRVEVEPDVLGDEKIIVTVKDPRVCRRTVLDTQVEITIEELVDDS